MCVRFVLSFSFTSFRSFRLMLNFLSPPNAFSAYAVYGPADWGHVSKDCNGRYQTPVDINTRLVRESEDHPLRVQFHWAGGYAKGSLKNNGHSPTFTVLKGIYTYHIIG